jgi:hypothetical protein
MEIKRVISKLSSHVYGRSIDVRYHRDLQRSATHIETICGVKLWFPNETGWSQCGDALGCEGQDPRTVVKIVGTHEQYKAAFDELTVSMNASLSFRCCN